MGCVASKTLAADDVDGEIFSRDGFDVAGNYPNHVVSLTSTTYGVLNLDRSGSTRRKISNEEEDEEEEEEVIKRECRRSPPPNPVIARCIESVAKEELPEVIDARQLMEDLADETPFWTPLKKPAALPHLSIPTRKSTPSPGKQKKKAAGKENAPPPRQDSKRWDFDLNRILKPFSPSDRSKAAAAAGASLQTPPRKNNLQDKGKRDSGGSASRRRSLSPFFDPALIASLERDHLQEGERIKKMPALYPRSRKGLDSAFLLHSYEEKCPPGGKNAVVLYTTTLRGIRKTFEDCNAVRAALESYHVQIKERDISMDSGYREELRSLMGTKEVRVPALFVKGRLVGGADETLELEEEGKLELLMEGLPRAAVCEGCAGVRFVMCMECNGSCKVLDDEQKRMVKCGDCNENGLIHCPMCCCC